MPKFNVGIRTEAGQDLMGRVQSGKTMIHYTKVVFSSLDLSDKTDDEIAQMTDVQPQELIKPQPSVLYKPRTANNDPETEIRAMVDNEILRQGFYINTYALYAADSNNNEILFGVTCDDHPSWLPAYDGVRPQDLTYNWDISNKNGTSNVRFTDAHDAYATYGDLQKFSSAVDYRNGQTSSSLSISMDSYSNAFSSMKNDLINDSTVSNISSTVTQNSININDYRQSLQSHADTGDHSVSINATSYTNSKADSAISQANAATEVDRSNLQNQINRNKNDILSGVVQTMDPQKTNCDFNNFSDGIYFGSIHDWANNPIQGWTTILLFQYTGHSGPNYKMGNGDYKTQVAVDMIWQNEYIRTCDLSHNTWSTWRHVVNDDEINNIKSQINRNINDLSNRVNGNINDNDSHFNNLQDQINQNKQSILNRPNWDDENWTRSNANQAAINALNQAKANTEVDRSNLQNQINQNKSDILSGVVQTMDPQKTNCDFNNFSDGIYFGSIHDWANNPIQGWTTILLFQYTGHSGPNYKIGNGDYKTQVAIDMVWQNEYIRTCDLSHNTWSTWRHVVNDDEINSIKSQINQNINDLSSRVNGNINDNNSHFNNLQDQINQNKQSILNRPNWNDENWTRSNVAPSLANSASYTATSNANQAATNALNQANATTEVDRSNLQDQINRNKNDILSGVVQTMDPQKTNCDFNNFSDGVYFGATNGWGHEPIQGWTTILLFQYTGHSGPNYKMGNGDYKTQVAIDMVWQNEYIRTCNLSNNSWTSWKHTANNDDISNLQNNINALSDKTNNMIRTVNNEGDAQSQSRQNPGTLYVYND